MILYRSVTCHVSSKTRVLCSYKYILNNLCPAGINITKNVGQSLTVFQVRPSTQPPISNAHAIGGRITYPRRFSLIGRFRIP